MIVMRWARRLGATERFSNRSVRWRIRSRTVSRSSASIGRTSAVCAMLILRWSTLRPSWASSALSMLRTSCFGCRPACARMWISLTSPSGVVTTRAERIPSRLVSRFSARRTPQGSGTASTGPEGRPGSGGMVDCRGMNPVTLRIPHVQRCACALNPLMRPHSVRRPWPGTAPGRPNQEVALGGLPRIELGDPDAHGDEARRIAEPAPDPLDARPKRFGHPRPALQVGPGQDHDELVAAVARRDVGGAHRVPDLARDRAQDLVPRLVTVLVVHFLEPVEVQEQHREPFGAALAALHLGRQPVP